MLAFGNICELYTPQKGDDLIEFLNSELISFETLYESMYRCKKGVGWKDSVAAYTLNGIENTLKLSEELKTNSYTQRPKKKILITHPKRREAVSIAFRDRVYQRSLNDNAIYPQMSKSFIYDNMACQKGKGTDTARNRLDHFLRSYYRRYGTEGFVLQGDIKNYYPNMNHDVVERQFERYLDPEVYERAVRVLRSQYEGETGYSPGSQMVQIAGISVLSPFDHFVKEQLRIKYYLRYQDDFPLIHPDKEYLIECEERIRRFLLKDYMVLHPEKTKIYPLSDGIKILGFTHKLTNTGKVIRIIDTDNVKMRRRQLRRMVLLAKKGLITKKAIDESFRSWEAHARNGNTEKVRRKMRQYYKELWEENENEV